MFYKYSYSNTSLSRRIKKTIVVTFASKCKILRVECLQYQSEGKLFKKFYS